jgi:hypothetical protein
MAIDRITYNKALRIPYDPRKACGYQPRPIGRLPIKSILVHTTNGNKGTSLRQEANYIANSREISSYYLIGKQGQIIQFLDPRRYIAYHAGCVKSITFSNPFSIGIEMHNTPAEGDCTREQLEALDALVRQLMQEYAIEVYNIETHRAVAVFCAGHPLAGRLGRKIDPSGFSDDAFYTWRRSLITPIVENVIRYKVISPQINIRTSPQVNDENVVGSLYKGDEFESVALKIDERGQYIKNINTWAHISKVVKGDPRNTNLGFAHTSNLAIIG